MEICSAQVQRSLVLLQRLPIKEYQLVSHVLTQKNCLLRQTLHV